MQNDIVKVDSASHPSAPAQGMDIAANGHIIHVLTQGRGPAVLFCHGFPDTAETWRCQMQAVAAAGYCAVALDLRGFGKSYAPADIDLYTSLHVVGDFVAVLDALGMETAVLVGHDWGADYAQRAAVMRPDRFRAIVSLSIPFAPRGEISLWDQLRQRGLERRYYSISMVEPDAGARFEPAATSIPAILYWLSASPPSGQRWDPVNPELHMLRPAPATVPDWVDQTYLQRTIRAFEHSGFDTGLNYYRVVQKTFDLTATFKNALIHQPSLYIWGAADGLCRFFHPDGPTLEESRKVQPGLMDIIRLDNAGHWIQHEAADRLNAELIKFLKAIESK
ncbi:alpha/beta hydrolase [Oxalobacteraceae bacterium OTU3CINTB1]|nr:alpha/beta hydrolase [Oxalobacteraceae bacterium OTU3CINTB1]